MDHDQRLTMPIVVRIERASPPAHTDVLEAVAKACLAVWLDDRATGEWQAAFDAWIDGRFRKVVRRARGAHWEAACRLPGTGIEWRSAQVRAFPPAPADELVAELRRLQVGGTDLPDHETLPPPASLDDSARLWLNPGLEMTTGKAAAQAGHASMLVWRALSPEKQDRWRDAGFPLSVRQATAEIWAALEGTAVEVADGGFTEVAPGSVTVRAEVPRC